MRTLLAHEAFQLTIERLAYQVIERHGAFEHTCVVGIQRRGAIFAAQLHQQIIKILDNPTIPFGKLDVTFHRDDYRMYEQPLVAAPTEINFLVDKKRVVLVDDVLYSGRTVRAALDALQEFGRPEQVELVALVDRRFNRALPVRADYVGITVDALNEAYVKVEWQHIHGQNRILFYDKKEDKTL